MQFFLSKSMKKDQFLTDVRLLKKLIIFQNKKSSCDIHAFRSISHSVTLNYTRYVLYDETRKVDMIYTLLDHLLTL